MRMVDWADVRSPAESHDRAMTDEHSRPSVRLPRRIALTLVAVLALGASVGAGSVSAAYPTNAPMVLQNISLEDIVTNRGHICHSTFTHVMKNFSGVTNTRNYLKAAATCGLKVIAFFSATADEATGVVYPSRVAYWVNVARATLRRDAALVRVARRSPGSRLAALHRPLLRRAGRLRARRAACFLVRARASDHQGRCRERWHPRSMSRWATRSSSLPCQSY